MSSTAMFIAEITLTLGVALGFGFWQLWDLRRLKAKAAAEKAAGARDADRSGPRMHGFPGNTASSRTSGEAAQIRDPS